MAKRRKPASDFDVAIGNGPFGGKGPGKAPAAPIVLVLARFGVAGLCIEESVGAIPGSRIARALPNRLRFGAHKRERAKAFELFAAARIEQRVVGPAGRRQNLQMGRHDVSFFGDQGGARSPSLNAKRSTLVSVKGAASG
jgi:hypothetical protein